jgi:hypothetical protein
MYVDSSTVKSKTGSYTRVLLRSSYRDGTKVRHRTVGNLSGCSEEEIQAIRLALKHKDQLAALLDAKTPAPAVEDSQWGQGPSVGAIVVLRELASQLGITAALGTGHDGQLALWQVIARALDQGSRLSSVRLARDCGAASVLGLPSFDEDDLYANLAWLKERQQVIEQQLFEHRTRQQRPSLYLYDVTSTYLEGEHNALAAFGYNRDGKRGKKQIVVGLLCDETGTPVALEAFRGNVSDPKTVWSQIAKLQQRFGAAHITLVGDRGMLRGPQLEDLAAAGMHYITAITKPQIETLLANGTLQMALFDQQLGEVIVAPEPDSLSSEDAEAQPARRSERFILRRNPKRQQEMGDQRAEKKRAIDKAASELNTYLAEHPRASVTVAHRRLDQRLKTLGLCAWLSASAQERTLSLSEDAEALAEEAKLDGCYVLRTDLTAEHASAQTVHDRYKSLGAVEQVFRRSKTVELEMRPVHVRTENSTRGHLLVVMLAYLLLQELGKRWASLDVTVAEGLRRLNTYCAVQIAGVLKVMLRPRDDVQHLITAAGVTLPAVLISTSSHVATRRKLPNHRPKRNK